MTINHEKGAALLSALLIMALCATLAVFLMLGQRLLIHQTSLVLTNDRMTLALHDVQDWAARVIQQQSDIRHVKAYQRHENGQDVSGMIYALNGRFNINALQHLGNIPRFADLLQAVFPGMSRKAALVLAYRVSEWIMPLRYASPYYLKLNPPYRTANSPIIDLSELRLVQGVTANIYAGLVLGKQPYITALPTNDMSINVNYASSAVFASLNGVSMDQARALVACRKSLPSFKTVGDFIQRCGKGIPLNDDDLTVDNSFYLVKASVQAGEQRMEMKSLIETDVIDNQVMAKILWQEYDGE